MSSATLPPVAQRRALTKRILKSLPWYPFIVLNLVVFVVFNLWPWLSMFQTATFKTDQIGRAHV